MGVRGKQLTALGRSRMGQFVWATCVVHFQLVKHLYLCLNIPVLGSGAPLKVKLASLTLLDWHVGYYMPTFVRLVQISWQHVYCNCFVNPRLETLVSVRITVNCSKSVYVRIGCKLGKLPSRRAGGGLVYAMLFLGVFVRVSNIDIIAFE